MSTKRIEQLIHLFGTFVPTRWKDYGKHLVKWEVFSERILENPLIIRYLPEKKSTILDVGCRYSQIPLEMAALGHRVYALDIEDYAFSHKNLTFVKEDIRKTSFRDNMFDAVTIISTVEHVGLGGTSYGDASETNGDMSAMQEIRRVLKPKGKVFLTVPFGKPKILPFLRVYDAKRITQLAKGFAILKEIYMEKRSGGWEISTYEAIKNKENTNHTIGNAFFIFENRK